MTLSEQQGRLFSIQHAFVMQFANPIGAERERLAGRIEHIVTGKSAHFQSVDHLQAFVIQVLTASRTSQVNPADPSVSHSLSADAPTASCCQCNGGLSCIPIRKT